MTDRPITNRMLREFGCASLAVALLVGYGPMTWTARRLLWSKTVTKVTAAPASVSVSVAGGSVSAPVISIK